MFVFVTEIETVTIISIIIYNLKSLIYNGI